MKRVQFACRQLWLVYLNIAQGRIWLKINQQPRRHLKQAPGNRILKKKTILQLKNFFISKEISGSEINEKKAL